MVTHGNKNLVSTLLAYLHNMSSLVRDDHLKPGLPDILGQ